MQYLKIDVFQQTDVFENFVKKSTEQYGINPLYIYSALVYTWEAGLKICNIKLDYTKDKHLLLWLENNIRGGVFSVMGDRYVELNDNEKIIYIEANILYGWAMT